MNYTIPLRYFLVMSSMLLVTGMWMFIMHTSFSITGTVDYYAVKSFFGLLETVTPHLFSMGILVFVLTHFFAVIEGVEQHKYRFFSTLFFLVMLVSNLSGFFIMPNSVVFSVLKVFTTSVFVVYALVSSYKLFKIS